MKSIVTAVAVAIGLRSRIENPAKAAGQLRFSQWLAISVLSPICVTALADTQRFDIPAQPLPEALRIFADQADMQLIYKPEAVSAGVSSPVSGDLDKRVALELLLKGTGFEVVFSKGNAATIRTVGSERPAAEISSRANTEEVTVIGQYIQSITMGKVAESLRDIPQSVSVVTRQRMEDQNILSLNDALKQVTGITQQSSGANDSTGDFFSRGYQSNSFQVDGLNVSRVTNRDASFDLAVFERVEIHRGARGLFKGAGDPGVSYNLVRKRAQAPFRVQTAISAGSWQTYRGELDVTGALTDSGRVRGRAVVAVTDSESYLDNVDNNKRVGYGTLEFDVAERTTVSVGAIWQQIDGSWAQGLPAYTDGRLPDVSRSASLAADFARFDSRSLDGFLDLEHEFSNGGAFKAAVRHQQRQSESSAVLAQSGIAADGTISGLRYFKWDQGWGAGTLDPKPNTDTSADVYFSTPLQLFGRSHSLLVGADYVTSEANQSLVRRGDVAGTYDIHTFDPSTLVEPAVTSPLAQNSNNTADIESYGVYGELRIKPTDALTLIAAGRFSWHDQQTTNNLTHAVTSTGPSNGVFTPYAGVIFDVSRALSLYAVYSESFVPQAQLMTFAGERLAPKEGQQYEAGIKGEFNDGRLTAHAAVYRINDVNRALSDTVNPGFYVSVGEVRSQGFETEISGQLTPRWNLTAGYAFTETEYIKAPASDVGLPFSTNTPKHNVNLWTHYRLPDHWVAGLEVGGGVRYVSEFYNGTTVRFIGDAYAVASLMAGYRINERYKLALNVDNLFDRKYWQRVNGPAGFNLYGAPRSVTMTLRATF